MFMGEPGIRIGAYQRLSILIGINRRHKITNKVMPMILVVGLGC